MMQFADRATVITIRYKIVSIPKESIAGFFLHKTISGTPIN